MDRKEAAAPQALTGRHAERPNGLPGRRAADLGRSRRVGFGREIAPARLTAPMQWRHRCCPTCHGTGIPSPYSRRAGPERIYIARCAALFAILTQTRVTDEFESEHLISAWERSPEAQLVDRLTPEFREAARLWIAAVQY